MPSPRPSGPAPLTDADVGKLREQVEAGKEPRVQLLVDTAAAPAGTRGPVVELRDPANDPEFIVLRVSGDEVPFSPSELSLPTRAPKASARRADAVGPPGTRLSAVPEPAAAEAAVEPPAPEPPAPTAPAPPGPERAPAPDAAPAPARPKTSRGGGGRPPSFTITLRFTGSEWTAETTRGGRRSKPQPVPLAAVRAFAERADDVELRRSVLAAVEQCRKQAQTRAEALRAELERVETALAQLEDE
jgi:hypothetical protein